MAVGDRLWSIKTIKIIITVYYCQCHKCQIISGDCSVFIRREINDLPSFPANIKSLIPKLSGTFTVRRRLERSDAHERGEWRHHCARVIRELRFEAQQLHVTHVPNYVHVARRSVQTAHDQGEATEVEVGQKLFQPVRSEIQPRCKAPI